MQYEFFKTTLVSKYIKYLLANTPIPLYTFISENDMMIKGCLYTYKGHILKCTQSGRFTGLNGTLNVVDFLTAQEPLTVNDPFNVDGTRQDNTHLEEQDYQKYAPDYPDLTKGWMALIRADKDNPGDYESFDVRPLAVTDDVVGVRMYDPAEFEIVDTFLHGVYKPGVNDLFESNVSYYDEKTHERLGNYLRYLKNMYDLDLMSLYNCFNHKVVKNIALSSSSLGGIVEEPNKKCKVLLVPIKFNKTYKIALDSDSEVYMKSLFYNKSVLYDSRNQYYLSDTLNEPLTIKNCTQFNQPFTYRLTTESADMYRYERYLYLAIQVSSTNKSSIVVLEGDYSNNGKRVISDVHGLQKGENTVERLSSMMVSKLSLLQNNDGIQHPFSDKLVEYLCGNTIDTREYIDDNVINIINQIGDFKHGYEGQWTNELRYELYTRYMNMPQRDELSYFDILGYVDSDIETAVKKGYLTNG